jgi:hypothetical protein
VKVLLTSFKKGFELDIKMSEVKGVTDADFK